MATAETIEVEHSVTVEVGVGMLRQSQEIEMAEEATNVSQVGMDCLALRWMSSAFTSTVPRRALAGAVITGEFPGSKMTDVLDSYEEELAARRASPALTKLSH